MPNKSRILLNNEPVITGDELSCLDALIRNSPFYRHPRLCDCLRVAGPMDGYHLLSTIVVHKEGIMIELKITKPAQKFLDELETKRRAKHFNAIFQIASSQVDGIDFDCCSIEVSVHQRSVNVGPDVIHIYPSFRRVGDDGGWQVPQDYIGKFGHVTRALFR